ncbi:hypothetical protein KCU95_g6059, partial [Aureobasidium melanogenum]
MNRPNPFASNSFFKPASSLLGTYSNSTHATRRRSLSLDSDTEAQRHSPDPPPLPTIMNDAPAASDLAAHQDASELTPSPGVPLVNVSRSPSPYARTQSVARSEDDEEYELRSISEARHLVAKDKATGERSSAQRIFQKGGIGQFLFGTSVGWRIYVAFLVFWVGGCQFGALLMNRPTRYTGGLKTKSVFSNISHWFLHGSGGIAGGGLFEYQRSMAKHVFPAAVVFLGKTVLSNISFAYAVMPMYMISRIAIIPLTLILTAVLLRQQHSIQTMSAAIIATMNLLMTSIRSGERDPWESVVAGVFSSIFVALYPILLLRGYRQPVSDLVPQGDLLSATNSQIRTVSTGTKEETRAYWRTLHYTSSLTILMLIPFVLISGELKQINRNCYFLDVPWFWFLMSCASLGGFGVFASFLLLVKATSPLSANFVSLPRSVFQIVVLSKFKMPAHSWVGAGLCVLSCLWYCLARIRDGRSRGSFGL